jgi:hypothetical protein
VSVALVIQYAMRLRHFVICGLSGCAIFLHSISQKARISRKKVIAHKMCDLIFSTKFVCNIFLFQEEVGAILCKAPVIHARF